MSTFEELEEAPILSIARRECSLWWAVKTDSASWAIFNARGEYMRHESTEDLAEEGRHTVMATPAVPSTARDALDLAWDLAHPVKAGQTLPRGTEYLRERSDRAAPAIYSASGMDPISETDEATLRTLDPLTEPTPDWLDAPAILASVDTCSSRTVRVPVGENTWRCVCTPRCPDEHHWTDLRDVTPLYPKEDA